MSDTPINLLELRVEELEEKYSKFETLYWGLVEKMESRLDILDPIVASIIPALGEMGSKIQAIIQVLASTSPEDQAKIRSALMENQQAFIEALRSVTTNMSIPDEDDNGKP